MSAQAFKRTRLMRPYKPDGSTTFPARGLPGVYLIYRANALIAGGPQLRYIGFSGSDVYKALYRHFQQWNDRQVARGERSERITYAQPGAYRVRVVYTGTAARARNLEKALILKHRPKDNPDKLETYTLTPALEALASEAMRSDMTDNLEAPF